MSDQSAPAAIGWLREDPRRFDLALAVTAIGMGMILIAAAPTGSDIGWPELAAAVGAFCLVLFRRVAPLPLLVVALIWTAVHVLVWDRPTPTVFAILVLVTTACIRLDRWQAIGLGAAIAVSLYVLGLISNDAEVGDARAVIGIAWTIGAVGVADAIRSWRAMRESSEAQIRSAVVTAEAQARQQVSEERLVIARELHDLLAHNLSVMNVQTGAALHLLRTDTDKAEESLTAAREAGRSVLDELGDLLSVLRHDDSDAPTASLPSVDEIDELVETMRGTGLTVTWTSTGEPRELAPAVSLAAYRISQEGLTNASKHGSGAVEFSTVWDDNGLTISIVNAAGAGAGVGGKHGLIGMRERATANGGWLTAERVDQNFVVQSWLPATVKRQE